MHCVAFLPNSAKLVLHAVNKQFCIDCALISVPTRYSQSLLELVDFLEKDPDDRDVLTG